MVRKLSELEKLLEPMVPLGLSHILKHRELCNEVVSSFGGGVTTPATLPIRIKSSPIAAAVMSAMLSNDDQGFWPAAEIRLFNGVKVLPAEGDSFYAAIREVAENLGFAEQTEICLIANQHGLDLFKLRAHSQAKGIFATIKWFGPVPQTLALRLRNESCPWLDDYYHVFDSTSVSDEAIELELTLPEVPSPGRYEVHVEVPRMGRAACDRDGRAVAVLFAQGLENDVEDLVESRSSSELELWKLFEEAREMRRDTSKQLRLSLLKFAKSSGLDLLCQIFERCASAPKESLNGRTHSAVTEVIKRPELQAQVVSYMTEHPDSVDLFVASGLPSSSLTIDSPLSATELENWRSSMPHATLLALQSSLSQAVVAQYAGDLVELWAEAEPGDTRRLTFACEGRQYRIVVEGREDNGTIRATLPTIDEDEIEVLLEPADDGKFKLYPEHNSRSLLLSGDALVMNILESPLYQRKKIKRGLPVNRLKPVLGKILGERKRPDAAKLTEAMSDARMLALKASRRAVDENDQQIITTLIRTRGKALEAATYGSAMLEWALPLPVASQHWKENMWAIDRETTALMGSAGEQISECLEKLPAKSRQLLQSLKREMTASKVKPTPLALEKAIFQFAILARCLARVEYDSNADDIYETFVKLERRIQIVCPGLLSYAAALVELVMNDGGL